MDKKSPGFTTVQDRLLKPNTRVEQKNVTPKAATPDKIKALWESYDPQIASKWYQTRSGSIGALVTVAKGETQATPGFSLGNGIVTAKYLKQGRFAIAKIRFEIGTSTKINGLVLDQSASPGEVFGETGRIYIKLPFPAAGSLPYFFGNYAYTSTAVQSSGALVHTAQSFQFLTPIAPNSTEVLIPAWIFDAGSPTGYPANTTTQRLWTPGDYFDVQLEVETDSDD